MEKLVIDDLTDWLKIVEANKSEDKMQDVVTSGSPLDLFKLKKEVNKSPQYTDKK